MEPSTTNIDKLFKGEKQLKIPLFQRHYVWDKENQWRPLWADVIAKTERRANAAGQEISPHFTGAIVIQGEYVPFDRGGSAYEIIDGQQRLTTFQIILCAFRDVCREAGDDFANIANRAENLIVNTEGTLAEHEDGRYKLVPTKHDRDAMAYLVELRDALDGNAPPSVLVDAYKYFRAEIEAYVGDNEDRARTLFDAIRKDFGFVAIALSKDDEPGAIFEALNARGKELMAFDLLRNYLFMRSPKGETRDALFEKYWEHFETDRRWSDGSKSGRRSKPLSELFLQHFLAARLATEKVTPLFPAYREKYVRELPEDYQTRDELRDLRDYSQHYLPLADRGDNSPVGQAMRVYHHLDITSLRPFILYLLAEAGASGKELDHILRALESFTVRRVLCTSQGHKDFNKFFPALIKRLRESGFSAHNLLDILRKEESDSRKWPQDSEVRNAFGGRWHFMDVDRSTVRYVLYRIDRQMRDEDSRTESVTVDFDGLTLEHILPERWQAKWKLPDDDGVLLGTLYTEKYKKDNPDWKNSIASPEHIVDGAPAEAIDRAKGRMSAVQNIGNLTLLVTSLNSSLGNDPFPVKKAKLEKHSSLTLNRQIYQESSWDVAQIKEREARLCDIFCNKLWPNAQWFLDNIPSE